MEENLSAKVIFHTQIFLLSPSPFTFSSWNVLIVRQPNKNLCGGRTLFPSCQVVFGWELWRPRSIRRIFYSLVPLSLWKLHLLSLCIRFLFSPWLLPFGGKCHTLWSKIQWPCNRTSPRYDHSFIFGKASRWYFFWCWWIIVRSCFARCRWQCLCERLWEKGTSRW